MPIQAKFWIVKTIKPSITEFSKGLWINWIATVKNLNEDFQILHQVMWIDFEDIHKGVKVGETLSSSVAAIRVASATTLTSNIDL